MVGRETFPFQSTLGVACAASISRSTNMTRKPLSDQAGKLGRYSASENTPLLPLRRRPRLRLGPLLVGASGFKDWVTFEEIIYETISTPEAPSYVFLSGPASGRREKLG